MSQSAWKHCTSASSSICASTTATFDGTTFSLFRNVNDVNTRDYGWALNYGFNNPNEGNLPICHAGQPREDCMMVVDSNWRTSPHSPLKIGDPIELAPAPRLAYDGNGNALADGGGSRYYSFEQLYVVGQGVRPWYGIEPRLDSAPLPESTLSGGGASVSYNYSEEPMRMFQQMANNIGIGNTKRFVEGRRLFHTSFLDGKHSENPDENPVFTEHIGQLGPRFNQERCIGGHTANGRSLAPVVGARLDTMGVLTTAAGSGRKMTPDPTYGFNIQQRAQAQGAPDYGVNLARYLSTPRTLPDGETIELQKPVYAFKGPLPANYFGAAGTAGDRPGAARSGGRRNHSDAGRRAGQKRRRHPRHAELGAQPRNRRRAPRPLRLERPPRPRCANRWAKRWCATWASPRRSTPRAAASAARRVAASPAATPPR